LRVDLHHRRVGSLFFADQAFEIGANLADKERDRKIFCPRAFGQGMPDRTVLDVVLDGRLESQIVDDFKRPAVKRI
jgi:hypothetical protein